MKLHQQIIVAYHVHYNRRIPSDRYQEDDNDTYYMQSVSELTSLNIIKKLCIGNGHDNTALSRKNLAYFRMYPDH